MSTRVVYRRGRRIELEQLDGVMAVRSGLEPFPEEEIAAGLTSLTADAPDRRVAGGR